MNYHTYSKVKSKRPPRRPPSKLFRRSAFLPNTDSHLCAKADDERHDGIPPPVAGNLVMIGMPDNANDPVFPVCPVLKPGGENFRIRCEELEDCRPRVRADG